MASAKLSLDQHHGLATSRLRSNPWKESPSIMDFWSLIAFRSHSAYNWDESTEKNYSSSSSKYLGSFRGKFRTIRKQLDYTYHSNYSLSRQQFQDSVIQSMLRKNSHKRRSKKRNPALATTYFNSSQSWIIFTAGVMGAGKTHTMQKLHASGQFPLHSFVTVDPDEIRRFLPEYNVYVQKCPEKAGELTGKEAGIIAEILTLAALKKGQNVLVDGSLRDAVWYKRYFAELRDSFPSLKIGIIHITAPTGAIFERVQQRSKETGRLVPEDVLLQCLEEVPKSVKALKENVDFFLEIHN